MSTPDEVAGIIGEIEAGNTAHDPVDETISEPAAEGADSGSSTEEPEAKEEPKEAPKTEDAEKQVTGETPKGDPSPEATSTDPNEPSKTEEKTEAAPDWKTTLPPPPPDYAGLEPTIDPNTGQITNMTPQEYQTYVEEKTRVNLRKDTYNQFVEGKGLEAAETILPEIKTNQAVRKMVEDVRIASILSGNQIDSAQAAQQVKEALGITTDKILEAKTEGANSAKSSIKVQKNAAVESGSTQKPAEPDKVVELQKRIKRGGDTAFAELLGIWDKEGKLTQK